MVPFIRLLFGLTSICALAMSGSVAGVPERSSGAQTLRVPDQHRELGEVYHVIPGAGTQLTWETDAPLLRSVATCNRVVGYVVAPFELQNGQAPVLGGALRIPVGSLRTGDAQIDATLHGPDNLDREQHPEILVSFVSGGPADNVTKQDNREHCTFKLVGDLTIRNKTVRFESPAQLALLPFAQATQQFSPSDLLVLRTGFDVALTELGFTASAAPAAGFEGKSLHLELYLMGTTVDPDWNFDPRVDGELWAKHLTFMTQLRDLDDPAGAYVHGDALMSEIWDDARMLNELAWAVLTDEQVRWRDLAFVAKAAERANALTDHADPIYLSTLARLSHERGDLDGAVEWARRAVEHLAGQPFFIGPPIRAALDDYESQARMRRPTPVAPAPE